MYQANELIAGLRGLVGFYPADDPAYPSLDTTLRTTLSGMYIDHKLCTIENLYNTCPDFKNLTYPDWASGSNYIKHDIVTYNSKNYRAKADLTNSTSNPATDTANWQEIDPFSAWLLKMYDKTCIDLVQDFVTYKKYNRIGKTLLDSQQLYRGPGRTTDRIIKQSRFVGFKIDIRSALGLLIRFDKVGFQASNAQSDFKFYLYNSSALEPVIFTVSSTDANSFDWIELTDAVIGYMRDNYDSESSYFFGYYEDDLEGQAIKKDFDISARPCLSCDGYNLGQYNKWSKYAQFTAISVQPDDLDQDRNLFDTSKVNIDYNTNWGMNLSMTVTCDITPFLLENKMIFANILSKKLSLELLETMAFSTRIGVIAESVKRIAMSELDPKSSSGSYLSMYKKELEGMIVDFSGYNESCFPCEDSRRRVIRKSV